MKVQALFKGASKAAPAKKTAAPKKTSSTKSSGGWLGSASGDINLDKWYVTVIDTSDARSMAQGTAPSAPFAQDKVG